MARAPTKYAEGWYTAAENLLLPTFALLAALLLFGVFVWFDGKDPVETWGLLFRGAFGDAFSWQNTLQRAAPLMLTALAVALPAAAGLTMIGGEGALVLGALGCAALGGLVPANGFGLVVILAGGALMGGLWVMLAGWLRQWRGVNETISSLLLGYIAIALFKHIVEGPLRDPASLNKPSTKPLVDGLLIGPIGEFLGDVHWGLVIGIVLSLLAGAWLSFTASGFSVRVVGGNVRTARLVGLPADRLILVACLAGGACAGLAGAIEVAAVHTAANASVIAGMGYTGILVSFVARHNPWAIPPVAVLFGGFAAAGSLLQRRLGLPDASVLVLQGFAFVMILAAEALRGRMWQLLLTLRPRPPETPPAIGPIPSSTPT
ncbi:ABC transporter permease [Pelomonas sp. KK5]|uniref:ABC transporter permease n=1 Tax=Pelomonas sp. KK5 TaxID=1855730 RepID=UPI00097C02D8|nr:ABC transporter permease [Pelomonas sp. KK5]